jgi:dihydroorotase
MRNNARYKMNPPLRDEEDRLALIEGLQDGTIDMIATDHAPHSAEEKASGIRKAPMGVVGIETAFPLLYTYLVRTGKLTLQQLVKRMAVTPRQRFNIPFEGYCVWNLQKRTEVNTDEFLSKGRSTPFDGWPMYGQCIRTIANGEVVWDLETMGK